MRAIGDGFIANYGAGNYTAAASALANGVNPEPAGGAASLWASHPRFGHPSKRTRASFLYQSILWEEILGKPALIQCGNKSPVPGLGTGAGSACGNISGHDGPGAARPKLPAGDKGAGISLGISWDQRNRGFSVQL